MTGIMQAVLGTAPAFNPASGLYTRAYAGYYLDDVNYFAGATQTFQAVDTGVLTSVGGENYSQQWLGYFRPNTTENYRFYLTSDDASYFWIGAIAISGFTTGNANINNGGTHGPQTVASSLIPLTTGIYYPVRIQYGNSTGLETFDFFFERVNTNPGVGVSNLTGLSFYNSSTRAF